jgi:DNA-binding transcriptional LysR family regulator
VDLRQLRYFVAIVEEGSLSRAAARLHVSQPPLSMQLKALEAELGATLVERGNRGVTPTAAGTVFYGEVRAVLARLEQARQKLRQVHDGEIGTLSVGFVSIADYGILPPALKEFRNRFPAVDVQLHELTTDAQLREMRAGRLDLGIALGPVDDATLSFETVSNEALILALPARHRLSRANGGVDLRQLAGDSFIVPPRDIAPGLYDLIVSRCHASGFSPRITQHARQMQTVISLVAAGMGVALVPSSVQNLRRSGVRYLQLRGARAGVDIGILRNPTTGGPLQDHFTAILKRVAPRIG